MPSKRKFSSVSQDALPTHVTPPAPQKPGKLKSILKRPSPPSRFLAATPSAQIRLEFHAASHNTSGDGITRREHRSELPKTPRLVEGSSLESKSEVNGVQPMSSTHSPSTDSTLDVIEDSAVETGLPKPLLRISISPKYKDDGDTEDMIADSQPHLSHSDDTHVMSGGLGPGESPYERTTVATNVKVSKRGIKQKKKTPRRRSILDPSPPRLHSVEGLVHVKCEQNATLALDWEQRRVQGADVTNVAVSRERTYTEAQSRGMTATKQEAGREAGVEPVVALSTLKFEEFSATPKHDPRVVTVPVDARLDAVAPVPTLTNQAQAVDLTLASSEMPRSQTRKVKKDDPPSLADVSKMLQEYEQTREAKIESFQIALQTAQARAAQLEAQLGMLRGEITSQSKHRQAQCSWQLNKFAILSRRTYTLRDEEETRVIGGCDDLDIANELARGMFQSEMTKLESIVEDLGQARYFIDMEVGMPQVQMRFTSCGMAKCRSFYVDSQWDLTVERVAAH